jgi:serine O-acetyltransferase
MANLITNLIAAQRKPGVGRLAKELLALYGVEFPPTVQYGVELDIVHRGFGVVVSPHTRLGDRVTIYHGVTLGRSDSWVPLGRRSFPGIEIGDDVVLCPGAKILGAYGPPLHVGTGTVIGANAVLTQSTGNWEVWAGSPARKIGDRLDRPGS